MKKIADDFDLKKNEHQNTVKQYAEMVRKCSYVHSLNYRVKKGCDEKYIYVNERFALTILLQASGCYDENSEYSAGDQREMVNSIKQMIYHLKYRNTNPKTLELFLIGMDTGRRTHF